MTTENESSIESHDPTDGQPDLDPDSEVRFSPGSDEESTVYQHSSEDPTLVNSSEDIHNMDGENECERCSYYAECIGGICECRNGWTGDGYTCDYNCDQEYVWDGEKCTPDTEMDEDGKKITKTLS